MRKVDVRCFVENTFPVGYPECDKGPIPILDSGERVEGGESSWTVKISAFTVVSVARVQKK